MGTVIQLSLAENPTTGYQWNLSVTPGLSMVGDRYVPDDPTGKLVGSGGTHVWSLETTGEGRQVVTGIYQRSWEASSGNPPDFTLTLEVSGGTCGADVCTIPTSPVAVPPRYHIYTDADNGKSVQEKLGETFGIRLQANPSTGYSWNLSLTKGLSLSAGEYLPSSNPDQRVGVGGVQSYTIVTTAKGAQVARAEYRQPWIPAGTVTHQDLEGGFYGILGDDGKKYDPLNLDGKYQVDGLRVAFEATEVQGTAGIHMWGTVVNLSFIDEIPQYSLNVTVV
jgi:inhibitor of cysteine peptidase